MTERVKGLIQECWAGDPGRRPSAAHVLDVLSQIESMVSFAETFDYHFFIVCPCRFFVYDVRMKTRFDCRCAGGDRRPMFWTSSTR